MKMKYIGTIVGHDITPAVKVNSGIQLPVPIYKPRLQIS